MHGNLKAQWQATHEKEKEAATPQKPAPRRASAIDPSQFGGGEKCDACGKPVYAAERLELGELLIHKDCLKCSMYGVRLTIEQYKVHEGKLYCQKAYDEVHGLAGGAAEGADSTV